MAEAALHTQVLVVGAGPVGLTLAVDLGQRGVRCVLVERKDAPQFLPKMERCNARTMEIYRRMGLAEKIRRAGFPRHYPMDVFVVTSLVDPPILRLPYPSVAEAEAQIRSRNDGTLPLEPYQLVSQYTLEPLLKAEAESLPTVSVRYGHELVSFQQDTHGVTARIRRTSDGALLEVRAQYLVGCDGGNSTVRELLGIPLHGEGNIRELCQALFRCEDLFERIPIGKGRHYHVADTQQTMLIVQDDARHFTLHAVVEDDGEMPRIFERVVRMPVRYELLYAGRWRQQLLLAERYRVGRVFLAGDAVHLVIPTGGLGMNTGVGDAADLAWKLAAVLEGWGGAKLLASYEAERRPVGERAVAAARFAALGRQAWRAAYKPWIAEPTPEGQRAREEMARIANVEQRKTNEMLGTELGYRYLDSPLVWPEKGDPPPDSFMEYRPSTWPGARLPHVWLQDGTALHDRLPRTSYALLRLGGTRTDTTPLGGVPLGGRDRLLRHHPTAVRDPPGGGPDPHRVHLFRPGGRPRGGGPTPRPSGPRGAGARGGHHPGGRRGPGTGPAEFRGPGRQCGPQRDAQAVPALPARGRGPHPALLPGVPPASGGTHGGGDTVKAPEDLASREQAARELLARYVRVVDDPDRIEEWPELFAEEAEYRVVTRENLEAGLPVSVVCDDSKDRIRDRVTVIREFWGAGGRLEDRHYNQVRPRHVVGPVWTEPQDDGTVRVVANFAVWGTLAADPAPRLLAVGEYRDLVTFTDRGPRFRSKWVVLDTGVLQDVFVYPL
jgi:2-polyprenyl-6-methoxyphenol hydroxylase-like FAD-dependent oxidoreductase/3-phenylpropionate/cinnamic acid dioxygenase small subunit